MQRIRSSEWIVRTKTDDGEDEEYEAEDPVCSVADRVSDLAGERERGEAKRKMSSGQGGAHSLAFRVMRLCRPSFHVDPTPLRLDPSDLLVGEDIFDDPVAAAKLPRLLETHVANPTPDSDLSYRTRLLLRDHSDPIGLSGLLVLPQSFGSLTLLSVSLLLTLSA